MKFSALDGLKIVEFRILGGKDVYPTLVIKTEEGDYFMFEPLNLATMTDAYQFSQLKIRKITADEGKRSIDMASFPPTPITSLVGYGSLNTSILSYFDLEKQGSLVTQDWSCFSILSFTVGDFQIKFFFRRSRQGPFPLPTIIVVNHEIEPETIELVVDVKTMSPVGIIRVLHFASTDILSYHLEPHQLAHIPLRISPSGLFQLITEKFKLPQIKEFPFYLGEKVEDQKTEDQKVEDQKTEDQKVEHRS